MTTAHLWAVGYDDVARADEVRDELIQLAWGPHLSRLAPFGEAYHQGKALRIVFTRMGGRKMDRSNLPRR